LFVMKFVWPLAAFLTPLGAQPDRFAAPSCAGDGLELAHRSFFVLCHSASLKVPLWTGHEIKPEHLNGEAPRPTAFRQDAGLTGAFARSADYRGSGFSRGHLVPAEDFAWSSSAIRSTFLLSNAIPQRQRVNAGKWRQLENAVRAAAACADAVYVFSGPIFDGPEMEYIGAGRVAVPTRMFKVVLAVAGERKTMYAAVVPNEATAEPLSHFTTTVDEVERLTGLDFFGALDESEERRLESGLQPLPAPSARCGS
jgi:endonuclease G, mitochondrial